MASLIKFGIAHQLDSVVGRYYDVNVMYRAEWATGLVRCSQPIFTPNTFPLSAIWSRRLPHASLWGLPLSTGSGWRRMSATLHRKVGDDERCGVFLARHLFLSLSKWWMSNYWSCVYWQVLMFSVRLILDERSTGQLLLVLQLCVDCVIKLCIFTY